MAFSSNGKSKEVIEESNNTETNNQIPLEISASRRKLLSSKEPGKSYNTIGYITDRISLLKFGAASAKFKQIADERDEISRSVASSSGHGFRDRFNEVFSRKINWLSLKKMCIKWIRDPMNLALFLWILIVAISGALLFLVMTGMLNKVIPRKSERDVWFEVNNQILNALFTLMCLYQHPKRFYHLVLLCRWKPEDISKLRKIYCKNGTYKPHEWGHMMVVVLLLHLNCFAQYALCGLNLGYRRSQRPAIGVGICISVAIAAPAVAGLYSIKSPLGRDYDCVRDEEAWTVNAGESVRPVSRKSFEKRFSFVSSDEQLQWSGGIFDFWDDISLAYLSLFCTFCVFGWNMERLGFGNVYVHIATFILFCMAPFWIFNLAAVNIDNESVREALSVTGIVLCAFGLLYGGFWRIQMRKRFNLPAYNFCCGKPAASDCTLWLFCCWCSLAQEVRTANAYDIIEDKLCREPIYNGEQLLMSPLPREDGVSQFRSGPGSPLGSSSNTPIISIANSPSPSRVSKEYHGPERQLSVLIEESFARVKEETMIPPAPPVILKEDFLRKESVEINL
ncbi:uncharacterized protein LOC123192886 [Mangifera indica]|uniref:uncharacterized protein LOC123192886 n=1 Tax=Mangifera indica TaxID=29780 RepID=UPI001CFA3291|nr:uncharacterized protein LOC123192886 [Mangifera indica]XP_044461520.1 uncharacterized protein LOC123192886 [Mangifera indica]XP_044461521.1 uncharacterized protein LOC123192886 [Mangifera indica]XP_044461522.1 uncharacterized protein LOC123192886 [Mangifera indica]